jgi:non-specific protein-tyrosine kinase
VVLIDSPPVLAANDATELLPVVDGVLLVARLGRTRRNAARSAANLLQSMNAPIVGVVALEATSDHAIYGYFGRGTGKDAGPVRAHARIVRKSVDTAAVEEATDANPEAVLADDGPDGDGDGLQAPAVGSWSSWRTR